MTYENINAIQNRAHTDLIAFHVPRPWSAAWSELVGFDVVAQARRFATRHNSARRNKSPEFGVSWRPLKYLQAIG
jgi:hypothetical protein